MPSDTAFLVGMQDGGLPEAHDSLGKSAESLSVRRGGQFGGPSISPRTLMSTLNNLQALGIDIDENNAVLKGLRAGIMTNYSLYLLYGAWRTLRKAQAARETAKATAEVTALAIAQQWHLIAQGAVAAGLVVSAFTVGEKIGSGDWNLPSFNMKNPLDRRTAIRRIESIRG